MEIQRSRLENIKIGEYGFSDKEITLLALIKDHLQTTNVATKTIEKALSSVDGLAELIDDAKETAGNISAESKFQLFLSMVDGKKIAPKYWTALKPFLQDCWKELEKCERAELLS